MKRYSQGPLYTNLNRVSLCNLNCDNKIVWFEGCTWCFILIFSLFVPPCVFIFSQLILFFDRPTDPTIKAQYKSAGNNYITLPNQLVSKVTNQYQLVSKENQLVSEEHLIVMERHHWYISLVELKGTNDCDGKCTTKTALLTCRKYISCSRSIYDS